MMVPFGVFVVQSQICERGGIAPVVEPAACRRKQTVRASMISKSLQFFKIMPLWLKQRAKLANVRQAFKSKYSLNKPVARLGT
jgi:hypothetical protein